MHMSHYIKIDYVFVFFPLLHALLKHYEFTIVYDIMGQFY